VSKKVWAELDRQGLLDERAKWEGQLQEANRGLAEVKRRAYVEGAYLPISEMAAREAQRDRLAAAVRGIQTELSKRKVAKAQRPFAEYFYDQADVVLGDDVFNEIYDRAKACMEDDNAKAAREPGPATDRGSPG
jgi:hypothetical protein